MTKRLLYLEGASGISGDMTVAALLDLGADRAKMESALNSMALEGFEYNITRKKSCGLEGCDFNVILHEHEHGHHHHEHRNLTDVYTVLDRGEMSGNARALAKKIFRIVAEAEAKAHGCTVEEVHFHEVGAIDSIADIAAASVLIDSLNIDGCVVTGLTEGHGTVHCQHGDLPVPVPAVLNIAQEYGIALRDSDVCGEMVTPTGIAIAAALRTQDRLPAQYKVERGGIGLGKRDFGRANLLRAMLLAEDAPPEKIFVLESNLDDVTGEQLGYAMEKFFEAGARDAHFSPCFMKKNRPAYLVRVIADEALIPAMERIFFECTTAIGLRKYAVERTCMNRKAVTLHLPCGDVAAKRCEFGELVRIYPEYESVRALSEKAGLDFQTVYRQAKQFAER